MKNIMIMEDKILPGMPTYRYETKTHHLEHRLPLWKIVGDVSSQ